MSSQQKLLPSLFAISCLWGCSDAELYRFKTPPVTPDRVTLAGRVCTQDNGGVMPPQMP